MICYHNSKFKPIGYLPVLKKTYDYFMHLATTKYAMWILALVAFSESSFFLIPPDILLIPIALANNKKAMLAASVCTISSVLGGMFGYVIGYYLRDSVAMPMIHYFSAESQFAWFEQAYLKYGSAIVFTAGFTPFPYKITTIASGLVEMNFGAFVLMSILSRGARFFLVAGLIKLYGERAKVFIEKNLGLLSFLFVALLFGCIWLIKL